MKHHWILRVLLLSVLFLPSAQSIVIRDDQYLQPQFSSGLTGVGLITFGSKGCTGSLLNTGIHVLTAAHCTAAFSGTAGVTFHNGISNFGYTSTQIVSHPDFVDINSGRDLAIITLNQTVDTSIQRLSLYSGTDELGQTATVIGMGRQGTGSTGELTASFLTTNGLLDRRQGTNVVDRILSPGILSFDFDDPQDPFRSSFGSSTPTEFEAIVAPGDSGGPVLINGMIAGVNSYVGCFVGFVGSTVCLSPPDINTTINSSYGEIFGATRVSDFQSWLQSQVGSEAFIPEPSSWALMVGALSAGLYRLRKIRNGSSN